MQNSAFIGAPLLPLLQVTKCGNTCDSYVDYQGLRRQQYPYLYSWNRCMRKRPFTAPSPIPDAEVRRIQFCEMYKGDQGGTIGPCA